MKAMKAINQFSGKIRPAGIAVALLLLFLLQGCRYYYKVETVSKVTFREINKYDSLNKYFIVHHRDKAWHFSGLILSNDTLYGKKSILPQNRYKFETTRPSTGNRYHNTKRHNEKYVLEEVHLYLKDSFSAAVTDSGDIKIAVSAIQNAEVYVKAKGRTTASWLIPAFSVPIIGVLAVFIGLMASLSSGMQGM